MLPREECGENLANKAAQDVHKEDCDKDAQSYDPSREKTEERLNGLCVIAKIQLMKNVLSPNSAAKMVIALYVRVC